MTEVEINDLWRRAFDESHPTDSSPLYAVARLIEQRVIERCAVAAWKHHMDTARKKGVSPEVSGDYCSAAAIRAMKG
jgi:hypothetical protein